MRKILLFATLIVLILCGWWVWQPTPFNPIKHTYLPSSEFLTLEIRHSVEEIMQTHKSELLKNSGYTFLEPKLFFYPYLLMDVKYSKGKGTTGEGALLWGLNDGEMVIHSGTWEKTHGFEDCIAAKATKKDLHIIEILAEHGGSLDREKLYHLMNMDQEIVDQSVESCRTKKLIAVNGNKLRLHFERPLLKKEPVTILDQSLVTQPTKNVHKKRGLYSESQVIKFAEMVFGSEFAIRRSQQVFLPVYALSVQNPDGSVLTTFWNALNGKKMENFLYAPRT